MAKFPEYKRDFRYTNELGENEAYLLLGLPIGKNDDNQPYIIGAIFAEEMYFWKSMGFEICVKINCPGGNILDGFSIMDAIRETDAECEVIGLCASMAIHMLLSAKKEKRTCLDYAKGMIHPPSGNNPAVVEVFRDSLQTILKNQTSFSDQQITDMLKDGAKDTWLSASDMKTWGLVSRVIPTDQTVDATESDTKKLYNIFNEVITNSMANESNTISLQAYNETKNELTSAQAKITELEGTNKTLSDKVAALELAEKTRKDTEAKAIVENAITEGKISIQEGNTAMKEQFVKMALEQPEAFKALIESRPATKTQSQQRSSVMTTITNHTQETPQEETYEWLANNNAKKLEDIMKNDPDKFSKLVSAYHERVKNGKAA